MKKGILFIFLIGFSFLQAQTFQIKYTRSIDKKMMMDSIAANPRLKNIMGEEFIKSMADQFSVPVNYELIYSQGKSIFKMEEPTEEEKKKEKEEEEDLKVGNNMSFRMIRGAARRLNQNLYKDLDTNSYIKQQDIFGKQFLITGELKSLDWEITDQTKTFGDFTCTVAKSKDKRGREISACFTEDIPINEGPDDYYGLPGLVVQVIQGPMQFNLTELKMLDENTTIAAPSEGKKITQEDFDKMAKEKMETMRRNAGQGGDIMIVH